MTKENNDINTISDDMDELLFNNEVCVGVPISDVSSYQSTSYKDNTQGLVLGFPIPTTNVLPYEKTSLNNNIQRSHETFENFVGGGDQGISPGFPTCTTQFICPNASPFQDTLFNNIIGNQGDAPTTQFIRPDVSPYQDTLFNNVVGDQGLVPEFTSTSQLFSPLAFAPTVLPNTRVSAISQNTTLSEHVQSGWVQTSNFSNHPTPYEHVQPNSSNHPTPSEHVHSGWVQRSNFSNHPTPIVSKSHCKRYERWTEDEHRLFLIGLDKCGWGDWKDISRLYILSKSPIQIASHAQKYKLHLNGQMKNKKRKSIHDITLKTVVVPDFVDQQQGLPPTPNATIQPQKMEYVNSYSPYYEIGGCSSEKNFSNGRP